MQPPPTVPPQRRPPLRQKALRDVVLRTRGGIAMFLPLWLLIAWSSGLQHDLPLFFAVQTALQALHTAGRLAVLWLLPRLQGPHDLVVAERFFVALTLFNALHWGAMAAAAVVWPPLAAAKLPLMFSVVGMSAAGTLNLLPLSALRRGYPLCAILPPILAMACLDFASYRFETMAASMYLAFILQASTSGSLDYWAAAVAGAELEERARGLERLSITDALTGVANRHLFDHRLAAEWSRATRDGMALSIAIVDVDHFKRVNDRFGHPTGDRCLRAVAAALQGAVVRPADLLARYGGEEFAVLLPDTKQAAALEVAERLRRAVEALALANDGHDDRGGGEPIALTCSVGVATAWPVPGHEAPAALQQADAALYAAKREGRNRVIAAARVRVAAAA